MKRACRLVAPRRRFAAALGWAVVLACGWTQGAFAQSRVVVRPFSAGDERVRDAVVQAIAESDGLQMVTNKDVDASAHSSNADLTTAAGRVVVARALTISAFVEGDVRKNGATTDVSLRVYDGRDGALLTDVSIHGPNASINAEVQKRVLTELSAAIRRGQPPAPLEPLPPPVAPAPEPAAAPPPPAVAPPPPPPPQQPKPEQPKAQPPAPPPAPPPEPQAKRERHALELGVGLLAVGRSFSYRDALIRLAEHSDAGSPALRFDGRWYPAAHLTQGFASNLGLEVNAQVMFPRDAQRQDASFGTSSTDLGIAARVRFPISVHELSAVLGYGGHTFKFDGSNGLDPGIPNVGFGFVRIGGEGRFEFREVIQLQLRLEYLALTGFGEIGEPAWFPHVSGGGFLADLTLALELSELFQIVVTGGTTRYFMSLNPEPTDPGVSQGRIAGGASDQYVYGMFGIRIRPY